jgi:hypothetical protein
MRLSRSIIFPIFILILVSLACSIPGSSTPAPKTIENQVATAASGTLTALAPTETVLTPEEAVEVTTETPTPAFFPDDTAVPPEAIGPAELRLAFSNQDGNLWVWAEGSSLVNLVDSGDVNNVVLSPDGEWITFTRTTADFIDTSIWAIRFNGMDEHLLVDHDEFMAMPLHPNISNAEVATVAPWMMKFVPGTHTLAFMTHPIFVGPGFFDNKDLWLVDVESAERTSLLAAGQGGHYYYSPNGSQIALVTATDISLINADGSNRRSSILVYPVVATYSEYDYHAFPEWSPDGSFLRVTIPPADPLGDLNALTNIYQLPTDGSPAILLGTQHFAPLEDGQFSPDLNRLAFIQQTGTPEDKMFTLIFSNNDGSGALEIARGSLSFVAWAPDSNHFAYVNHNPRAISMGQVASAGTTLLDANPAGELRWISNDRFFFFYQVSPEWQLRLGSLGAPSTVIANLGSGSHSPSYDFVTP